MDKVFFIVNKYSGGGFQPKVEGRIIDACARLKLECTIEFTQHPGHATNLAKEAIDDGFSLIFAVGGDGTVNEVARALVNTSATLGIIPKGSGNGLARHLGIPLGTSPALRLLNRHKVISIDTLLVNGHVSVNVSGIGFDAHVASRFGKHGKRGLVGYTRLVLREFRRFEEFDFDAKVDDVPRKDKSFIIAFANSSQFGNNARVAPHASVCDGFMDVCFIKKVPLTRAVGFTSKIFTGQVHRSRYVDIVKSKEFETEFPTPMPYHIDGEPCTPTEKFVVSIRPSSLNVVVPTAIRKY